MLMGRYVSRDMINTDTGEIYAEAGAEITEEVLATLTEAGIDEVPTLAIDHITVGPVYPQHVAGRQVV